MSFESLTAEERARLASAEREQKLLRAMLEDPELGVQTKRMLQKKDPSLRFADVEALDAEERAKKAAKEETDNLRRELEQERAARLKAEEVSRIRERGFDPERVYKAMEERGIVSLDTALAMFEAEQQLGESSAGSVRQLKSPMPEIPKEVMNDNGSVDIDALRGHLIGKYMEETGQGRTNPLGFLKQ